MRGSVRRDDEEGKDKSGEEWDEAEDATDAETRRDDERSDENVRWDVMRQERGKEDKARVGLEVTTRDDVKDERRGGRSVCDGSSTLQREEHLCEMKRGKNSDWW